MDSLLADILELKNSKPIVSPPRNKEREKRVMQFQQDNNTSLAPETRQKTVKRGGMFDELTFCLPLLDSPFDISPQKLAELAKAITNQGGKLVQFRNDMTGKTAKYILIDERTDVGLVREALRGKMFYVAIINYKWIEDCIRKFVKLGLAPYNLERNYKASEAKIRDKRKEMKGQEQKEEQSAVLNKDEREEQSDSDTVVMDEIDQDQVKVEAEMLDVHQNMDYLQRNSINSSFYEQDSRISSQQQKERDDIKQEENEAKKEHQEIDSDGTERMSEEAQGTEPKTEISEKSSYFRIKKKDMESILKKEDNNGQESELMSHPQVNRRKTKLSLGSHGFATNNMICDKLKQMQQIYENTGDRKQYAYLRAIAAIRNYGREIKSAEELRDIQGLGKKTIAKIHEFLKTGSIAKVENKLQCGNSVPHKELLRVHGIGLTTAEELYRKGFRSIQDLQKDPSVLNKIQRMCLKYVQDFEKRIPRDKVGRMLEFVKQTLFYLVRTDSHHEIEAVGSYRRGKATCGDIDILITRKDGHVEKALLQNLVNQLEKRKFIVDHITQPKTYNGRKSVNYMGVCRFQEGTHRIDLKHYPADQYAFAILYFTGSDLFNREMRMTASEKGLILGDHGIRRQERNVGKPWRNTKIPVCYTERDIFNLLGMEYRPPCERQL